MTHIDPRLLTESQLEDLIGKRLKQHRLRRNLTQTELAVSSGLARRTITSVENGNDCTLGTLIRLVRALHGDSSGVRGAAWLWEEPLSP